MRPEALQSVRPHRIEILANLAKALWPGAIQPSCTDPPLDDEAGLAEHAEVLADRWRRHREVVGDLTGGQLPVAHERKDLAAARLDQGAQGGVHEGE